MRRIIDVMRDRVKTYPLGSFLELLESGSAMWRADGIMRDVHEMIISDVRMPATSMLISTVRLHSPTKKKEVPRI